MCDASSLEKSPRKRVMPPISDRLESFATAYDLQSTGDDTMEGLAAIAC